MDWKTMIISLTLAALVTFERPTNSQYEYIANKSEHIVICKEKPKNSYSFNNVAIYPGEKHKNHRLLFEIKECQTTEQLRTKL